MPTHISTQRFKERDPVRSYITPWKLFKELDAEFQFTVDVAADSSNTKCDRYYDITGWRRIGVKR
jgi:DNA N-6-adenine-methyltransferase (Dam)